eukprot:scaffold287_cov337-Pavlova_lutheri.AAC.160
MPRGKGGRRLPGGEGGGEGRQDARWERGEGRRRWRGENGHGRGRDVALGRRGRARGHTDPVPRVREGSGLVDGMQPRHEKPGGRRRRVLAGTLPGALVGRHRAHGLDPKRRLRELPRALPRAPPAGTRRGTLEEHARPAQRRTLPVPLDEGSDRGRTHRRTTRERLRERVQRGMRAACGRKAPRLAMGRGTEGRNAVSGEPSGRSCCTRACGRRHRFT